MVDVPGEPVPGPVLEQWAEDYGDGAGLPVWDQASKVFKVNLLDQSP